MADTFTISLDLSSLISQHQELADKIEESANEMMQKLSIQAHAHIVEFASEKLHTRRDMFINNLKGPEETEKGTWVVSLGKEAHWIEDGLESNFSLLEKFLASPKAKTSKWGNK